MSKQTDHWTQHLAFGLDRVRLLEETSSKEILPDSTRDKISLVHRLLKELAEETRDRLKLQPKFTVELGGETFEYILNRQYVGPPEPIKELPKKGVKKFTEPSKELTLPGDLPW